ncbi:GMC oxidoreductase [Neolentinus lepideus HHB14362 ss-1]|uniref:GMC oxidoreductase n=1 Tax=Neolentinus lepideus HHB14362 ss-1 TaxID=1314782 RepID=A0A165VKU0_9AGAM|nr:GMC oxidoreductase [Neolentinus lepideus HHB14362 ss-1]
MLSPIKVRINALLSVLQALASRSQNPRIAIVGLVIAISTWLLRRAVVRKDYLVRDVHHVAKEVRGELQAPELDDAPEYDVIIVGGGTAGCVLASRLSEDPAIRSTIRVLLVEAGGSGVKLPLSRIPVGESKLFHSKHDYDLYTVPQSKAGEKTKYWPRGKILGGCKFQCGAPSDYNEWARLGGEGASSWAYRDFQRYFLKFERYSPHKLFSTVDGSLRGTTGLIETGYFGYFSPWASNFIEGCKEIGIPYRADLNTIHGTTGTSKVLTYIDSRGSRVSTESAYLTNDVLKRPNLTVLIHTTTTRIVLETIDRETRAVGVELAKIEKGPRFVARACKQVVLSAGAIHTPQILMLSGIGPAEQLKQHSIPLFVDLPGVGSNLLDHPVVDVNLRAKKGVSINYIAKPRSISEVLRVIRDVFQYLRARQGPLTTNIAESVAFVRSSHTTLFPPSEYQEPPEDTTSGPDAPDIELFASPVAWKDHGHGAIPQPAGELVALHAVLLRPTSKGTVSLKSSNPFDKPIIDPRYLDTQHDVDVLVRALQLLARIMKTSSVSSLLEDSEVHPDLDHRLHELSAEELQKTVRERVETLYHPTSTARMGPWDQGGVVDASLKVYRVSNLRVADASIFPNIIAGHTAAPVIAVAEKAADLIKAALKD